MDMDHAIAAAYTKTQGSDSDALPMGSGMYSVLGSQDQIPSGVYSALSMGNSDAAMPQQPSVQEKAAVPGRDASALETSARLFSTIPGLGGLLRRFEHDARKKQ